MYGDEIGSVRQKKKINKLKSKKIINKNKLIKKEK